jgi:hypothetical protein
MLTSFRVESLQSSAVSVLEPCRSSAARWTEAAGGTSTEAVCDRNDSASLLP